MKKIVVLTGPPGVGKSTIVERLVSRYGYVFPVPHTSRPPRLYEVHEQHYYFTERERMIEMVIAGEFAIWTYMLANYYGYEQNVFYEAMGSDRDVVLYMSGSMAMEFRTRQMATLVFLRPPDGAFLSTNIQQRGASDDTDLLRRRFHTEDLLGYTSFYDIDLVVERDIENTMNSLLERLGVTVR